MPPSWSVDIFLLVLCLIQAVGARKGGGCDLLLQKNNGAYTATLQHLKLTVLPYVSKDIFGPNFKAFPDMFRAIKLDQPIRWQVSLCQLLDHPRYQQNQPLLRLILDEFKSGRLGR